MPKSFFRTSAKPDEAARVRASKPFAQARSKADGYINNKEKLAELVQDAADKAVASGSKPLSEMWEQLTAAFRLVKAYANGSYRQVPWSSIVMIVASLLYFVMPADLVPDFLFAIGLMDDAALLAYTLKTLSDDIGKFKSWESAAESTVESTTENTPENTPLSTTKPE
ncbi:MAG: YkvA family protein [Limnobacter sp.]|nr:YkvA family protein [Limnobacter sp.]